MFFSINVILLSDKFSSVLSAAVAKLFNVPSLLPLILVKSQISEKSYQHNNFCYKNLEPIERNSKL